MGGFSTIRGGRKKRESVGGRESVGRKRARSQCGGKKPPQSGGREDGTLSREEGGQ